ncbi:MAG: VIT domain-containing protein [Gemmatimonadaceae bacterium]
MLRPTFPIRWTSLLLLFVPFPSSAAAQDVGIGRPICGTRNCITTPCPPPPCPTAELVVRTGREVRVVLDGRVLRYEVTERWTNHGRMIGEADYVLPLPRGAAFEDLALEIDGEMVTGEALDAGRARRVYEEIVRQRRDPALVEWMGMGVLRTRIFPIAPGETRTVVVRFRAVAEREGDALRVDVPAPRGNGTMASGTTLSLRWPAGEGFGEAWSPTHKMDVATDGNRRLARVSDAVGTVTMLLPVRDGRAAALTVLTHAPSVNDGYALITLTPPLNTRGSTPRDVSFVIDVSGSMSGVKMEQARAAGRQLLNSLGRDDRFRLIAFSGDVTEFREAWTLATPQARREAEEWLTDLRASGGTNIAGALERALEARSPVDRLALVLFLTDGAPTVGERRGERLAARAAELRGTRRIFTFGLGADVNVGLLEQLALDGAGTAHFVRPEEDVERVVGVVAERITRPVATNLRVRAEGVQLHAVQPAGRLDLFAGQELVILARYRGAANAGRIVITGDTPNGPVTWEAQARFPDRRTTDAFVGRLWATQRVGWLSAERRRNGASGEVDQEIRSLGERWGIPTELTSYLVLEPGMVASGQGRLDAGAGSGGDPVLRRERDVNRLSGVTVTDAAAPSAPERAFEAAKAAAGMRESRTVADAELALDDTKMRRTANRVFTIRDSVWTDSRAEAAGARKVRVRAYSPAYFALMERVPELREILALGERVQAHGARVTLVLATDGVEMLSAPELTAFTRDW